MKIKNYTTSISAQKSIAEIEQMLVESKATHIMKNYRGDGRIEGIVFMISQVGYKLPSNAEKVYERLKEGYSRAPRNKTALEEQAERVAWRVLRDWLHAQLSLIYIGQAELDQVMLPYAFDGQRSFYEIVKDKGYLKLLTNDESIKQNVKEIEVDTNG